MRALPRSLWAASFLAMAAPAAFGQVNGLSLSAGFDFSSGKYGTSNVEELWALPLVVRYDMRKVSLRAELPWVRRSGFGRPEIGPLSATRSTTSGQGDVRVFASFKLLENRQSDFQLALTGGVKFGTAERAKLLGTGENDFSIQSEVSKGYGRWTSWGTLGWRKMGDQATLKYRDPWFSSFAMSYALSDATSAGLAYDYRRRIITGGSHVSELSAFLSHRFSQALKLQGYLVRGFTDASPHWGAGALLTLGF